MVEVTLLSVFLVGLLGGLHCAGMCGGIVSVMAAGAARSAASAPARRVIHKTNAIESIHSRLRKIIRTRGYFPSDDAATKLIWLALRNITADWGRAAKEWKEAMNQFAIAYGERFTRPAA